MPPFLSSCCLVFFPCLLSYLSAVLSSFHAFFPIFLLSCLLACLLSYLPAVLSSFHASFPIFLLSCLLPMSPFLSFCCLVFFPCLEILSYLPAVLSSFHASFPIFLLSCLLPMPPFLNSCCLVFFPCLLSYLPAVLSSFMPHFLNVSIRIPSSLSVSLPFSSQTTRNQVRLN